LAPSVDGTVQVTTTRRWSLWAPPSHHAQAGGVLTLTGGCPPLGTLGITRCAVDERVTVPSGTRVRVTASTGDLTGTNLAVASLEAHASRGSIEHRRSLWVVILAPGRGRLRWCSSRLGIDTAGREILTFLSGASDWPKNDGAVLAVGRLLRRYHDAVATFVPPPGMPWRIDRPLGPDELVCHNDLQPANTVFRDGEPVAFIDWDLAGPAPAIFDLARAAWDFIPLRSDRFCLHMGFKTPPPRARRLRLLCDGYGLYDCPEVLSALHELQHQDLDGIQRLGRAGVSPFAHFLDGGEDQYVQADIDWLAANRKALSS
jgi:phosphotransferase family enzyme